MSASITYAAHLSDGELEMWVTLARPIASDSRSARTDEGRQTGDYSERRGKQCTCETITAA